MAAALQDCQDYVGVSLQIVDWDQVKVCDCVIFCREGESRRLDVWNVGIARDAAEEARGAAIAEDRTPDKGVELSQVLSFLAFTSVVLLVFAGHPEQAFRERFL